MQRTDLGGRGRSSEGSGKGGEGGRRKEEREEGGKWEEEQEGEQQELQDLGPRGSPHIEEKVIGGNVDPDLLSPQN